MNCIRYFEPRLEPLEKIGFNQKRISNNIRKLSLILSLYINSEFQLNFWFEFKIYIVDPKKCEKYQTSADWKSHAMVWSEMAALVLLNIVKFQFLDKNN